MSFVKDDDGYTRGIGAVASMDAVSSARRRAAARSALAMARRDAVMSRHTLGRISQTSVENGGGGGGGGGGARPTPPRPKPPGLGGKRPPLRPKAPIPPKPLPPRFPNYKGALDLAAIRGAKLQIKSPGSVLPPAEPVKLTADPITKGSTATAPTAPAAPTKAPVTIVAGGASNWSPGANKPEAPMVPPAPEMVDIPDSPAESGPAAAAPVKKPSSNLLMYAVLGAGALWLLTRK